MHVNTQNRTPPRIYEHPANDFNWIGDSPVAGPFAAAIICGARAVPPSDMWGQDRPDRRKVPFLFQTGCTHTVLCSANESHAPFWLGAVYCFRSKPAFCCLKFS